MDTMKNYIDIIIDGLNKKNDILDRILDMNQLQMDILSAEDIDIDKLNDNIENKSRLIEELESLDEGFTAVYDRIRKELVEYKDKYSSEITLMKSLINLITEKSVAIQRGETRNRSLMESYFTKSKSSIKSAKRSTVMANNYYKNMRQLDGAPQFFDTHN